MIKFYKSNDPYGFLNNFFKSDIFIYDKWYPSVEHAYQSRKTFNQKQQENIRKASGPRLARDLGQVCDCRSGWDDIKYSIMKECLIAKFTQNKDLLVKLMDTNDQELVEDSPIDSWWGCGKDGLGMNMLGKCLMEVRGLFKSAW
jgi:ribA/ribD-fused uncharacterized protein